MSEQNNKKRETFLPRLYLYPIVFISIYIQDVIQKHKVLEQLGST
jgi:hypothetical protein